MVVSPSPVHRGALCSRWHHWDVGRACVLYCPDDLCMAYGKLRVFFMVQARLGMCLLRLVFPQILILYMILPSGNQTWQWRIHRL